MSELTSCNHCSLRAIRRIAKEKHLKVTLLPARWGMGGQDVFVHPKEVHIAKLPGGEDGPRAQYRKAWFMELTDKCCC